ncbi:hypothetical protein CBOM_01691 [Ceraceosorus bombacis]|uniref:Biotin-protein ligase N-terminal domain-containing protein n=1 Tax=Ceraceosorus bombacis TaxID=401625 RepID=A0A0N7L9H4_9BASI|nr:hypothetical protein CBOM_01691 [Ceraceosorus bombacis]
MRVVSHSHHFSPADAATCWLVAIIFAILAIFVVASDTAHPLDHEHVSPDQERGGTSALHRARSVVERQRRQTHSHVEMGRKARHFHHKHDRPVAAVYRGPVGCEGCSESVAKLLRDSPPHFRVHYLGPDETHDVSPQTLSHLDLFAWPGGGDDQNADYLKVANYTKALRDFVSGGGKYAGFCMGAFLARGQASNETFFGLLPEGSWVSSERFEKNAQVKGDEDTIILTDWTFHTGPKKGTTEKDRWQYFQDGGLVHLGPNVPPQTIIKGHYTWTNDVCSAIIPYGKGQVGLVGVHPEADKSWYSDWNGTNPQGIRFDIGHDFIDTLWRADELQAHPVPSTTTSTLPTGTSTAPTR